MFVAVLCKESKAKEKNQVTQEGRYCSVLFDFPHE